MEIAGFVVVRRPEHNTAETAIVRPQAPPQLGGVYYAGIDRMQWCDIAFAYHDSTLPEDLKVARDQIWEAGPVELDFKLCGSLDSTKALLEFSNRAEHRNEILAVSSKLLSAYPTVEIPETSVCLLGVDIYCHGYGSPLAQGLFASPDDFAEFESSLNEFGLFEPGSDLIDRYAAAYRERASTAGLEPMPDLAELFDVVTVSRVVDS